MPEQILKFISSLKLTVVCLMAALILVLVGTLAQESLGLYAAQHYFFQSLFVDAHSFAAGIKKALSMFEIKVTPITPDTIASGPRIPVFPGGYLIGTVLVVNLIAAHLRRFRFTFDKAGIHLTHFGLILLLLGQLATDKLASESAIWLRIGETKNYSEDFSSSELAIIDQTGPGANTVYSIPDRLFASGREIRDPRLPFLVRMKEFWPNAFLTNGAMPGAMLSGATTGVLKDVHVLPLPKTYRTDERNVPGAVVELIAGSAPLGSWLVSSQSGAEQTFNFSNRTFNVAMRSTRYYTPYSLTLLEFTHEKYKGTEIPKHFASRVRVENKVNNENRETTIFMNNPLRYEGATYYQASFAQGDTASMLQVVRNPGWLTPYFSCVMVGLGLTIQFSIHLVKFIRRRTA